IPAAGAQRLGIDAAGLADRVSPYLAGLDAGQIPRGIREWPVRVTLPRPPGTLGPQDLAQVAVPVTGRTWLRLGDLATLRVQPGETEIDRDNQRTMVASTARLSGRDLGSAMDEIQ